MNLDFKHKKIFIQKKNKSDDKSVYVFNIIKELYKPMNVSMAGAESKYYGIIILPNNKNKPLSDKYDELFGGLFVHGGKNNNYNDILQNIIKRQQVMLNRPKNFDIFVIIDNTNEDKNYIYSNEFKELYENMLCYRIGNIILIDTEIPPLPYVFDIIIDK